METRSPNFSELLQKALDSATDRFYMSADVLLLATRKEKKVKEIERDHFSSKAIDGKTGDNTFNRIHHSEDHLQIYLRDVLTSMFLHYHHERLEG